MARSTPREALPLDLVDGIPVVRLGRAHRLFEQAVDLLADAGITGLGSLNPGR